MDQTDEYIKEKMSFFASNIDDFEVGDQVIDLDGSLCTIIDKSLNTIMVSIGRKSSLGINTSQWFDMVSHNSFGKRFKKIT